MSNVKLVIALKDVPSTNTTNRNLSMQEKTKNEFQAKHSSNQHIRSFLRIP